MNSYQCHGMRWTSMLQHTVGGPPKTTGHPLLIEVLDGSGPPIFMVDSMLSSQSQWRANLAALVSVARHVLFEIWGHGSSPAPEDPQRYAVTACLAEFERVRLALGAPQVVVCGASFGAGLTMRYSLHHPESVLAQVFTNSMSAVTVRELSTHQREADASDIEAREAEAIAEMPFRPLHARQLTPEVRATLDEADDLVDPKFVPTAIRHIKHRKTGCDRSTWYSRHHHDRRSPMCMRWRMI